MTADPTLFDLLADPPARPALKEPRLGAVGARWTRYKGAHKPCDLCVQSIHERGVAGAPPPAPAGQKRVGPNDTLLLCGEHGEEMKRKDNAAEAEAARRRQAAAEARKAYARRSAA